jgi:hypothetical protein
MTKLNLIPNRRWLQFRLRTVFIVVTLAAGGLGWWRHRQFCLERAEAHWWQQVVYLHKEGNYFKRRSMVPLDGTRLVKSEEQLQLIRRAELHRQTKEAYWRAVWFPWLRWTIKEPPCELVLTNGPIQ